MIEISKAYNDNGNDDDDDDEKNRKGIDGKAFAQHMAAVPNRHRDRMENHN